ncbi:MAG TPA: hypothetical protein VKP30_15870, partial [Polyangiaceae bacterium]|nr:hypothetical protein [Polyangiaceae bacterium]
THFASVFLMRANMTHPVRPRKNALRAPDTQVDCTDVDCQSPGGDCTPAPALDRTVASTLAKTTAFLYARAQPINWIGTSCSASREASCV